jgi:hypothetical protein
VDRGAGQNRILTANVELVRTPGEPEHTSRRAVAAFIGLLAILPLAIVGIWLASSNRTSKRSGAV